MDTSPFPHSITHSQSVHNFKVTLDTSNWVHTWHEVNGLVIVFESMHFFLPTRLVPVAFVFPLLAL
jgi:hypothetical protein